MRSPRRLMDARTLEAETDWPAPVCRRIAGVGGKFGWTECWWLGALALVVAPALPGAVLWVVNPGANPGELLIRVVLWGVGVAAALGLLAAAAQGLLRRRTRRVLARYLEAPWCPACGYPVVCPRVGRPCGCPECGATIPAEVAALAVACEVRARRQREQRRRNGYGQPENSF